MKNFPKDTNFVLTFNNNQVSFSRNQATEDKIWDLAFIINKKKSIKFLNKIIENFMKFIGNKVVFSFANQVSQDTKL